SRPRGRELAWARVDERRVPGPSLRGVGLRMYAEEGPDRAAEGNEDARRCEPRRGDARDPRPEQRDQDRAPQRREQAKPAAVGHGGHPRSSDRVSTSSERFRRLSATTRPSPTQTSEAATAITASAKIWPAPLCQWRESAISARLPALSISSSESSTTSVLRRIRTPSAPIPNRQPASAMYQATLGPSITRPALR